MISGHLLHIAGMVVGMLLVLIVSYLAITFASNLFGTSKADLEKVINAQKEVVATLSSANTDMAKQLEDKEKEYQKVLMALQDYDNTVKDLKAKVDAAEAERLKTINDLISKSNGKIINKRIVVTKMTPELAAKISKAQISSIQINANTPVVVLYRK
jgi:Na+-translocating ferredoxin:NAD+ oxidoreductase RnfG subunit